MQYMLLFTESADDFARRQDPVKAPSYWAAWMAYTGALAESGIMVSGANTVRLDV